MFTLFKTPCDDSLMMAMPNAGDPFADPDMTQRRRRHVLTTLLLAGTVAAFSALLWQGLTHGEVRPIDPCCAITVPPADVVFLVDTTDALTETQLRVVCDKVRQTRDTLAEGSRLTLLRLDPDGAAGPIELLSSVYKPADGRTASQWTENERLLRERYRAEYVDRLDADLDKMAQPHEAATSPLLEALHALAPRLAEGRNSPRRELVIVSDMLQNSPLLSQFRRVYSYPALAQRGSVYLADLDGLNGVGVTVYQLRDRYPRLQTAKHTLFWQQYFEAAGARDFRVVGL